LHGCGGANDGWGSDYDYCRCQSLQKLCEGHWSAHSKVKLPALPGIRM
jgi:hypothetical protein